MGPYNIEFSKTFYNIKAVLTEGSGHRDYLQNASNLKFFLAINLMCKKHKTKTFWTLSLFWNWFSITALTNNNNITKKNRYKNTF